MEVSAYLEAQEGQERWKASGTFLDSAAEGGLAKFNFHTEHCVLADLNQNGLLI